MTVRHSQWVSTNRRTDADILKEIVPCHSPMVVISRDDPSQTLNLELSSPNLADDSLAVTLFEPENSASDDSLDISRAWPNGLSLLVIPARTWSAIVVSGPQSLRANGGSETSLADWLIALHNSGTKFSRQPLANVIQQSEENVTVSHSLLLGSRQRLSPILRRAIETLAGLSLSARTPEITALQAGLFQWHDALDDSHTCSQSIEGQGRNRSGDYWHAIMHRREPDYGNSKYWFRRVGSHPIFAELGRRTEPWISTIASDWKSRLLKSGWDPFAFVDFCEMVATGQRPDWTPLAERIQELEMLLLLDRTYRDAAEQS